MPIKPIKNMLKRSVVLDISMAAGLGVAAGYGWWYGVHVPRRRVRDLYYAKLETERQERQQPGVPGVGRF